MTRAEINRIATPIPIVLSVLACALAVASLAVGFRDNGDEGWQAHIWQLLMGLQIPLIALFALTADRDRPMRIAAFVALYLGGLTAACAPVWLAGL